MAAAIAFVLVVLVVTNVWVHLGPGRVHVVTGPLAALVLLALARMAGLTWQELGLGQQTLARGLQLALVAAVAVAIVYAAGVAIPLTRGAFRDTRYRIGLRAALYTAFVAIPLGTVLFEEVAFRSVLWGLLSREFGVFTATVVSACLFGLWHVLPATVLARTHTSVRGRSAAGHISAGRRRVAITVFATIAFTALAGIVFAELRRRSGSLVAPIGLHWATNGLGVLAAARVWAVSPSEDVPAGGPTPEVTAPDGTTADMVPSEAIAADASAPPASLSQPAWKRIVRRLRSGRS
jgi:membrane protease YdiL (CAAX protease family)